MSSDFIIQLQQSCYCHNPKIIWIINWEEAGVPYKEWKEVHGCCRQAVWSTEDIVGRWYRACRDHRHIVWSVGRLMGPLASAMERNSRITVCFKWPENLIALSCFLSRLLRSNYGRTYHPLTLVQANKFSKYTYLPTL